MYGQNLELCEAKDAVRVFRDQQSFVHLVEQPMMVLDVEWPGFVTKDKDEPT